MKRTYSIVLFALGLGLALAAVTFPLAGRSANSVAAPAVNVPFASPVTIDGSFDGAVSVHAADLDRDGDLDVFAAATTSGISWWENNGSGGGWTEHNLQDTGANDVCAADVDGDNAPDILLASSGDNAIFVYENDNLAWSARSALGFTGAAVVHAADLDGDGRMDVLGAATTDGIAWWKNNGGNPATWSAKQTIDADFDDGTVHAADIDGDGDLDVISARAWGTGPYLVWWENDGSGGGWTRYTINGSPDHMSRVHAADIDGDGDMDVIASTDATYTQVSWFQNDGSPQDGGWTQHIIDGSWIAAELFAGDLDGDGDTDVLGTDTAAGAIVWWENDGTPASGSWTQYTVGSGFDGATGVFAADLDGDRDPDVLGAANVADDVTWWESLIDHPKVTGVAPQRNTITASLSALVSVSYDQPIQAGSVTSHTFALHGMQTGLVTGTHSVAGNTVTITPNRSFHQGEQVYAIATSKINNITGTAPVLPTQFQFNAGLARSCCFSGFVEVETDLPDISYGSAVWGDYDGDSDLDIFVAGPADGGWPVRAYRNDGADPAGGWAFVDTGNEWDEVSAVSVAWGDYDNDGDLDVLFSGEGGTGVARNDGHDTFTDSGVHLPQMGFNVSAAWGDYNNDGYLDILIAGFDVSYNPIARVYRNNGKGVFSDILAGLPGVGSGSVAWGDYDDDGDLDVLLTGCIGDFCDALITRVYRNDGAAPSGGWAFTDIVADLPGVGTSDVAWGDYDNDGDLDILLAGCSVPSDGCSSAISRVYRNNGDNTFSDVDAGLTGVSEASVAWGDYDNDGDLDVLLTGCVNGECSNTISWVYRNNSDDTFSYISAGLFGLRSGSIAWGDYDGDGDLDILLTGCTGNACDNRYTLLYRNDDYKVYLPLVLHNWQ